MSSLDKKKAAALRFDSDQNDAPCIVAKGEGDMAFRMERLARENHVDVVRDKNMTEILSEIPTGEEIPQNVYRAVAGIYAMLKKADERALR